MSNGSEINWEAAGAANAGVSGSGLYGAGKAELENTDGSQPHSHVDQKKHYPHDNHDNSEHKHHTKLGEKIDHFLHSHEHKHREESGGKVEPAVYEPGVVSPATNNAFQNLR